MLNSTDAKLMVLRKHIITHKAVAHPSYPTGVVQISPGLSICQCIFQYFSCIGDAMLGSSDIKLGALGGSIITHNVA